MLATFNLSALAFHPIDIDRITIERALSWHGQGVIATFIIAKPPSTHRGQTTVGAGDKPDGAERWAMLKGKRFDLEVGQRVTVSGVLRVTDWPACYVDGVLVPGWVEIRVDEGK